jgi:hypothetical protein
MTVTGGLENIFMIYLVSNKLKQVILEREYLMSASGDTTVFFILLPIFVAVGIYLIIYNKKKSAVFRNFCSARGLRYQKKDDGQIEKALTEKLRIEEPNYTRAISGVKDIIRYGEILIFRCTELLDLYKYGNPQTTHFPRAALSFEAPHDASLFFIFFPKTGEYKSFYPPDKNLNEDKYFQNIKSILPDLPPPHPVSITLSRGTAFIYLEPLVVGREKESDLDYLLNLGKKLKDVLG